MGWQQCATGWIYNSSSGHGHFLVGACTGKILLHVTYSKSCTTCWRQWKKKGVSPEDATKDKIPGVLPKIDQGHCCPQNYSGSAKSMEANGAVAMVTELYNTGIAYAAKVCTDDDSSARANIQPSYKQLLVAEI